MKKLVLGSCFLIMSTVAVRAAFFDTDDFSSGYDANAAIDSQKQWSAVGVIVTNSPGVGYTNDWAVYFPEGSAATNTVSESPIKAWTDFRIKPSLGVEPENPEPDVKSALFFFNSDGAIQVWDGISADWIICTNDVWGHPVPKVSTEYVRVSVYQDFNTKTYAVMLDDRVIVQDVGFPTNGISNYSDFVVENADENAYLDNLRIRLEVPADLAANSNHVALADARELNDNGYVARTLHVNPANTAPVPYYASLQTALDAYREGDIITVAAGTYAENITISNTITFANAVIIDGTLDITGAGSLTTSSGLTVSNAISLVAGATLNVTGGLSTTNTVTLAENATLSVTGNLTADATIAMAAGATLTANTLTAGGAISLDGATMTVAGTLDAQAITLANHATLNANGTVAAAGAVAVNTGSELHLNGENNEFASLSAAGGIVAIGANRELDVTGVVALSGSGSVTIASGGTFTIDGGLVHTMAVGTTIVASSGTFDDGALDVTGTFTIQGADYITAAGGTVIDQPLPFHDNFDRYAADTPVSAMKLFGWNAEAGAPSVTAEAAHAVNSIILPDGSAVSLAIDDANKGERQVVWTDYYLRPAVGEGPGDSPETSTRSFLSYVNTNGNLVVYDSAGSGGWVEASTNAANVAVDGLFSTDAFKRVTIYQNFDTKRFVVFVDSTELVHEGTFPDNTQPDYDKLHVDNTSGGANAWLDTVLVTVTLPLGLTGDHDGDGMADGEEIHWNGDLTTYSGARGSVFRFM